MYNKTQTEPLFNIEKTKHLLEAIPDIKDQIRYLYRQRTDYQQQKNKATNPDSIPFDEQVDLEINFRNLLSKYQEHKSYNPASAGRRQKGNYKHRLRVVGELKPMALAFRALMQHKGDDGRNYLLVTYPQMIHFLSRTLEFSNGRIVDRKILFNAIVPRSKKRKKQYEDFLQFNEFTSIDRQHYYQYNIDHVKKILSTILHYEERILFIHRVHTNFLQHRNPNLSSNTFSTQIELELQQQRRDFDFERQGKQMPVSQENRIRINGRVNVLMTFFYQLLVEFPDKYDLRCLDNSKREIIDFVLKYFERKNGKRFSPTFLRNTLTPSKVDKRCSVDKQVKIKMFWKIG